MTKDDSGNNINLVVGPYKSEMTAKRLLKLKNDIYFFVLFVPQRLCVKHFYIINPLRTWCLCVKIFSKAIPISSPDPEKECYHEHSGFPGRQGGRAPYMPEMTVKRLTGP
jgi:hypothetical protein